MKVTFTYKGRERTHQGRAEKLLAQILIDLAEVGTQESVSKVGPNLSNLILTRKR